MKKGGLKGEKSWKKGSLTSFPDIPHTLSSFSDSPELKSKQTQSMLLIFYLSYSREAIKV